MKKIIYVALSFFLVLSNVSAKCPCDAKKGESLTIAVLTGTVREVRKGPIIAKEVVRQLKEQGCKVIMIDPKEYNLPLLDKRLSDYPEGKAPAQLVKLGKLLESADGYVFVSAIYNSGIPPALKNLIDHFQRPQFADKPAALVTYSPGQFGGVQVVSQWRAILPVLQMIVIPTSVSLPRINETFSKEGSLQDKDVKEALGRLVTQLKWYASALKAQKAADKVK